MLESIVINTSIFIPLVPIILGVLKYRKLTVIQNLLFWMIVFIASNQFLAEYLESHILNLNKTMPFYRVYILLEFVFLSFIFKKLLNQRKKNFFINSILILFTIIWLYLFLTGNKMYNYPTYLLFSEGIIILLYAANYFQKTFKEGVVVNLLNVSGFWISFGLIMYFASNTLLFLFGEFVTQLSNASFSLIWTVHGIITILLYISYAIALRCKQE